MTITQIPSLTNLASQGASKTSVPPTAGPRSCSSTLSDRYLSCTHSLSTLRGLTQNGVLVASAYALSDSHSSLLGERLDFIEQTLGDAHQILDSGSCCGLNRTTEKRVNKIITRCEDAITTLRNTYGIPVTITPSQTNGPAEKQGSSTSSWWCCPSSKPGGEQSRQPTSSSHRSALLSARPPRPRYGSNAEPTTTRNTPASPYCTKETKSLSCYVAFELINFILGTAAFGGLNIASSPAADNTSYPAKFIAGALAYVAFKVIEETKKCCDDTKPSQPNERITRPSGRYA